MLVIQGKAAATLANVQRSAKRLVRGCENFVSAHAHLFCLALPGSCLARFAYFLADLCKCSRFTPDLSMICDMSAHVMSKLKIKALFKEDREVIASRTVRYLCSFESRNTKPRN